MIIDLQGQVCVLTGAGRGIGREILEMFVAEGVKVYCLDANPDDVADLNKWAGAFPDQVVAEVVDVRDLSQVRSAVERAVAQWGRVDILVNNAGVGGNGTVEELTEDQWDLCMDVNVKGVFATCQAVIPHMKKQQYGRIINAASFAAIVPMVGSAAYAASKSAVVQFSRTLAGELGPYNITVNSYAPGMIPTTLNSFAEADGEVKEELLNTLTLRRWGDRKDIGRLLCFLASDAASYITGTLVDISGGKLATQVPARAYSWAGLES